MPLSGKRYIFGRTLFISLIVAVVVVISLVFVTGLSSHRNMLENALLSISIIFVLLFAFVSFCLYRGVHIRDDMKNKLSFGWKGKSMGQMIDAWPLSGSSDDSGGSGSSGSGWGQEIVVGIVALIAFAVALFLLMLLFELLIWPTLLLIAAGLYWMVLRSFRLILSKSRYCRGNLPLSMGYAFKYTLLYVGWFYGVIWLTTLF